MKTLRLTSKDFTNRNGRNEYSGKTDVSNFDGHLEIEANIGWAWFKSICVSGSLTIEAGTSIEAGYFIKAGDSIKARGLIKAGTSIEAGGFIKAGDSIKAGYSIEAGYFIKAGYFIEAGGFIKAGTSINAGLGMVAGLSITCKDTLTFKYNLFAGATPWKQTSDADRTVTCGKLEGGTIQYGLLVETGLAEDAPHADLRERLARLEVEVAAVREALAQ